MNAPMRLETDRPTAWPALDLRGEYRSTPRDFLVEETLAFEPDGAGAHRFLYIEKQLANTETIGNDLARHFGVARMAVSFAGRKDRRAIARQWFSVETPRDDAPVLPVGCSVLRATRHARKLRRGELAANAFTIRLAALEGDRAALATCLDLLAKHGFPNYFGEQRFGRGGANVGRAHAFLTDRRKRAAASAFEKGLYLSVGRAVLFNAVLGARVRAGTWNATLPGEVERDGAPTGPLWGRGRSEAALCAGAIEAAALAPYADWRDALEHVGLRQDRRALVARPRNLAVTWTSDGATLRFALAPGSYATQLLCELGRLTAASTEACAQ